MVSRSPILGYHGCDRDTALKIVAGQEQQIPSRNEYDWLGGGLYFWEDSFSRAMRWAQNDRSGKIKTPAVLGAIIDLGNCLNLIDTEHLGLVKTAYNVYREICTASGLQPLENKGKGRDFRARHLDRIVIETLHNLRKEKNEQPFDTVRAFFVEGEPLYANAGLRSLDHIQICVRNPAKIVGYFLPRA